ncbi:MAG: YIP1 family protein, partial [Oscillospiraceae bacterium]
ERGEFIGFFGSEKVVLTADTMINYFWKQILSDEQTANMKRLVPTEFVSFCIDQNDFIYTIRKGNDIKSGQVKKLNARGDNIMPDKFFGDRGTQSALTAITVDKSGFITILDSGSGRLFQYDMDGNMLYAFGGRGNQAGLTQEPVDIASIGEDILVLDKQAGLITKMQPTGFAKDIRAASALCADGRYTDAMSHWQGVLKQDGSYDLANKGLGKAYEGMGEFSKASQCYKKAQEKVLYSEAFSETRGEWLREYFVFFMLGLTAVIILPIGIIVYRRKRVKSIYELKLSKTRYPLYCLTHPFIGYEDMKERKGDDIRVGSVIILLFFVITVMNKQLTGFAFNNNRTDQFSLPFTFISSVGVFAAFVICNWSITTIMDGKGRLKEIFNYCAYALVPYIIGTAVLIALSYALTSSEAAFMQIGQAIVLVWTGISMLTALKEVHMYSMGKTVLTVLMTIAGLIVFLIICAISYNVVTQFIEFIGNIITEVRAL